METLQRRLAEELERTEKSVLDFFDQAWRTAYIYRCAQDGRLEGDVRYWEKRGLVPVYVGLHFARQDMLAAIAQ